MLHAPPISLFFFDHRNNFWWAAQSIRSSLCSLLYSPLTLSLLGPHTLFSILFLNTLNLRSSHIMSDQVSRPHYNRQEHRSVYLNLYIFGSQTGRQKILHRTIASIPWL
jgi:hypothetical protein